MLFQMLFFYSLSIFMLQEFVNLLIRDMARCWYTSGVCLEFSLMHIWSLFVFLCSLYVLWFRLNYISKKCTNFRLDFMSNLNLSVDVFNIFSVVLRLNFLGKCYFCISDDMYYLISY